MDVWIYLQIIFGFIFLIKGADFLVASASTLAKRFHVSDMVIGLTIVSFGTSAPELLVNVIASWEGKADLALGNIIGSNIANILLIFGVSALVGPFLLSKKTAFQDIPMSFLAGFVLAVLLNDAYLNFYKFPAPLENVPGAEARTWGGVLERGDAIILLIFFFFFLYYVYSQAKLAKGSSMEEENGESEEGFSRDTSIWKLLFFLSLGLVGLSLGSKWIVQGATGVAKIFGVSDAVIGITIVGVGTSLPEVAASAVAARKGNIGIAVGNVIGSNIFNLLWVLGLSALINPMIYDVHLNLDLGIMLFVSFLFFAILFVGRTYYMGRVKAVFFLLIYISYIASLFLR